MGGNAFKYLLLNASFPRMSPTAYHALKSRLQPILETCYEHVAVAPECPGKVDFGDVDFVASGPREGLSLDDVKNALRATCSVLCQGNRVSNYAIPVSAFDHVPCTRVSRRLSGEPCTYADIAQDNNEVENANAYIQVDVNVCADHAQLERTVFYTSYGDLGWLFGLLAQTAGLSFSVFGMKLVDPLPTNPPQTYYLSTSIPDILAFFGLSMDRWQHGFTTQDEIFEWVCASPFVQALAERYRAPDYKPSAKSHVDARPMRRNFIVYLQTHDLPHLVSADAMGSREEKMEGALRFFGKAEEHARLLAVGRAQKRAKEFLNGTNVIEWTGVQGRPVGLIMDTVKERLSDLRRVSLGERSAAVGDITAWQYALLDMSVEEVRALVMDVKEDLQREGKLCFDWQAAKAVKPERKRQPVVVTVAVQGPMSPSMSRITV